MSYNPIDPTASIKRMGAFNPDAERCRARTPDRGERRPGSGGNGRHASLYNWQLVSSRLTTGRRGSKGRWETASTSSLCHTKSGSAVGARHHGSLSHGLRSFLAFGARHSNWLDPASAAGYGVGIADFFGHLPAVLVLGPGEQPAQMVPRPSAHLRAGEGRDGARLHRRQFVGP